MEITISRPYSFIQLGRRKNQEDARFPDVDSPESGKTAFVVCDGVGGQDKGEVASRIVADTIGKAMNGYDLNKPFGCKEFSRVLEKTYQALNSAATRENRDMATTMTFVCFHGGGVFAAHVGDSRIYQIRPGEGVIFRSDDHSLVNALVHSGNITPEQAENHPQSNVITRCLSPSSGDSLTQASTLQITDVKPRDYFFLCTDGVEHCVDDSTLCDILATDRPDREKMDTIAKLSANSSDNNTAYLIRVADVKGDSCPTDATTDDNQNGSSDTVIIDVPLETVRETDAKVQNSFGSRISDFLNKWF